MTTREKRAGLRFSYRSPVSYIALGDPIHPPDKESSSGEIVDLSDSGVRIRLKAGVFEDGTVLQDQSHVPYELLSHGLHDYFDVPYTLDVGVRKDYIAVSYPRWLKSPLDPFKL